ncbi:MAG: UrcA family protein, partial [Hyphomonadaceae bacterium]|nr:UrcA family protein [Hyphomonadaceae bacterium]
MIKLFLGLATLALACAAPAMAQPAAAAPQQARVAIGNLDLTAEPDARLMLARIDRAAVELCGGPGDIAHQR